MKFKVAQIDWMPPGRKQLAENGAPFALDFCTFSTLPSFESSFGQVIPRLLSRCQQPVKIPQNIHLYTVSIPREIKVGNSYSINYAIA